MRMTSFYCSNSYCIIVEIQFFSQLTEAADLIYKLNALAAELPRTEELIAMRKNIADRYAQIESQLVDKFCEALDASDVKRMKLYASTLQHFPEVVI